MRALKNQWDYVCKQDKELPVEEQTVFTLRRVPANKIAQIEDSLYSAKGIGKKRTENLKTGSQELEILALGIVNWKNLQGENGEIVFDPGKINDLLSYLPKDVRTELKREIVGEKEIED